MIPQWLIERKRNGHALDADEIGALIDGYTRGEVPDYQMAAFAMAVYFRGMTPAETAALTKAMMRSGDVIAPKAFHLPAADKHSTGGIGDKISLILAPLAACCGIAVPMISGRGLGITGGTLDKLEAIPGYRTTLSTREFIRVVNRCGCSIIGQTPTLAPADRKFYALRDVTATVPSIPLITASILSKKLAEGIRCLVLDVKCGRGAFMRTPERARALARSLQAVCRTMGRPASSLITAMDQPLGASAGNALEVVEAINVLRGEGPADVRELTVALGARMLIMAGRARADAAARSALIKALDSGAALEKFRTMVALHGGDPRIVDDPRRFVPARRRLTVKAQRSGYVAQVDAELIGRAVILLGGGRTQTTDEIDHAAGISNIVKVGDPVNRGQPLAVLHAATNSRLEEAGRIFARAITIAKAFVRTQPLIMARLASYA